MKRFTLREAAEYPWWGDMWGDEDGEYVLYSEAQARIEALAQELENIAHMNMDAFEDYHEFKVWAQNRAKHTLAAREADGV